MSYTSVWCGIAEDHVELIPRLIAATARPNSVIPFAGEMPQTASARRSGARSFSLNIVVESLRILLSRLLAW